MNPQNNPTWKSNTLMAAFPEIISISANYDPVHLITLEWIKRSSIFFGHSWAHGQFITPILPL